MNIRIVIDVETTYNMNPIVREHPTIIILVHPTKNKESETSLWVYRRFKYHVTNFN